MEQIANRTEAHLPDAIETEANSDVFAGVWRRKWVVACVACISLALGYLYFLQSTPVYQSEAQILLVKREAELPVARVERQGGYEDTLSTHMLVLSSPLIVGRAVAKHGLASLSSLQGEEDPTTAIIDGLTTTRAGDRTTPDPNVIDLAYEGPSPQDCAAILSAIVQSYERFLGDTYQDFSEEAVQLISQAKGVLHEQLTEKETAYRKFRQESPLLWKGGEGANVHEARMGQIEEARSEVMVECARIKARIDAIETALRQGGNRAALLLLVGDSESSDSPKALRSPMGSSEERMFAALLEEQMLLEDYGGDHPKVAAARKMIDLMREHLGSMPLPDDTQPADFLGLYLESLRQELAIGEKKQSEYDILFQQEREAAKALASFQLTDDTYRNDIKRTQKLFDGVMKRLEEINLVKDYGGISTQVISPPSPGRQVQPKLAIVLTIFGVFGLFGGLGLGYVVEVADKSFRSPADIRRQLGLPLVGHIPMISAGDEKFARADNQKANASLDPILCTFHQPKGRDAEGYRAVRTSLYFSTRGEGHKVIQVTSPDPRDGKTTLAANLAVSIADSGKKVLLMDADFRRPQMHKLFGLDNTSGVSSVIGGKAEVAESTKRTAVEHLSVMPCGPRPPNPAELLTSPRLKELIDAVREKYDFIIIDTPPLLAVTDPSAVAPRVDAVLLVTRLTKTARDGMMRAAEILNSLGAKVLGVVVNGVGRAPGYGYRGYRYGYAYSYKYRYRYGYGSGKNGENVYYTDEESDPKPLGKAHRKSARREKVGRDAS